MPAYKVYALYKGNYEGKYSLKKEEGLPYR
jgi:hypothetical protein